MVWDLRVGISSILDLLEDFFWLSSAWHEKIRKKILAKDMNDRKKI